MVDTNSNPEGLDFIIPANDDASDSIKLIVGEMCKAINEGLSERKVEREKEAGDKKEAKPKAKKASAKKTEAAKEPKAENEEKTADKAE
jgi:small subunit ribosomal protein S2